jgi:hypothetical protein
MRNQLWIVIAAFALTATSCNLTAIPQTTATPLPSPTLDTPILSVPTPTLVPIETLLAIDPPTFAPTPTSRVVIASPKNQPVNCRFGPGVAYAIVGALDLGRQAEMVGRNPDSSWWYVKNPSDPSTVCWLSAEFVNTVGNVESLPVVGPPEIGVTNIRVTVDPVLMNVACGAFPQSVSASAQVTSNGPAVVTWRWETSMGDVSAEEILLFEAEGTKTVQGYFSVRSANDHWINLHVLLPNDRSGGSYFKVTCVP